MAHDTGSACSCWRSAASASRFASSAQENDRAALIARDTATGWAHWTTTTNGTRSASLGMWHGVTTDGDGRVTRLSLKDNTLPGAIPPAVGTVTTLRNQEDLTDEQYEALNHALGMSVEDIRALGLSPDELQVLLDGFTEETVVVGSRGQPRTVAASPVPVDVLSTYNRPEYDEALAALQSLQHELEDRNQSAAGSLAEGLDETLTLHRLGVYGVLGRSLKTTNGLESINALIEERCAKVDHWQHSSQRHRWLATALLDIEPRLRKVIGYRHLPRLRDALRRELKIDTTTSKKKAA